MQTNRQSFGYQQSAPVAYLRGVVRIDGDHLYPGTFSLVVQDCKELSPPCIVGRFGKTGSHDAANVQRLNRDHAVTGYERPGRRVVKVLSRIGDVLVLVRHALNRLLAAVTPAFAAGKMPLRTPELLVGTFR